MLSLGSRSPYLEITLTSMPALFESHDRHMRTCQVCLLSSHRCMGSAGDKACPTHERLAGSLHFLQAQSTRALLLRADFSSSSQPMLVFRSDALAYHGSRTLGREASESVLLQLSNQERCCCSTSSQLRKLNTNFSASDVNDPWRCWSRVHGLEANAELR